MIKTAKKLDVNNFFHVLQNVKYVYKHLVCPLTQIWFVFLGTVTIIKT